MNDQSTVPWYYYPVEQARFEADTAEHQLRVLQDDGLYRHLSYKAPATVMYWYELVTTPGQLTFRGDMGCYVWSRVPDMIEFFAQPYINPGYWGEKLAAHSGYRDYSEERFRRFVTEEFEDQARQLDQDRRTVLWERVENGVLDQAEFRHDALEALDWFQQQDTVVDFGDPVDWDFDDYTPRYLWACHAVRNAAVRRLQSHNQAETVVGTPALG